MLEGRVDFGRGFGAKVAVATPAEPEESWPAGNAGSAVSVESEGVGVGAVPPCFVERGSRLLYVRSEQSALRLQNLALAASEEWRIDVQAWAQVCYALGQEQSPLQI